MRKFDRLAALISVLCVGTAVWALVLAIGGGRRESGGAPARVSLASGVGSGVGEGPLNFGDPFSAPPRHPLPLRLDRGLGPLAWSAAGPFVDGHVLVGFTRGTSAGIERSLERRAGAIRAHELGLGVLLYVPRGAVPAAIDRLKRDRAVTYAEPDYVMRANGLPNDSQFALQWGLQNLGQGVNGTAGTANADERAVPAWNVTTGSSSIVVAVTDTGVEYTHPDLAANIWSNPGGIGGCAAGTHGFDVLGGENACTPMDTDTAYGGHGTHVAGIIGAVGNNGVGVTGVNWNTTILPVKWLDSNSSGATSDLINALQMVIQAKQAGVNVRVVNDSPTFVGTAYSQALSNEIDQLGANDILFVTPAGNTSQDDDTTPRYPCSYDRPNELCVAATDQNDQMPSWANWGLTTVDLAAPGNNIYSTLRNASYGYISGSSMSAAEVSGAAALVLSTGYQSVTALKADILNNVDPIPSLSGRVRTGGRLDICRAMPGCTMAQTAITFGKTTIGGSVDTAGSNRKRVNRYTVAGNVAVTKLSMYLQPTSTAGTQPLQGVIYADSNGSPGSLIATSSPLTFSSSNAAGWYDLPFSSPVNLAAGAYWIGFISGSSGNVAGFRYDYVAGSRDLNTNTYTAGPSNPFGTASGDGEQMSLYATFTTPIPIPASSPPADFTVPAIFGTAQPGQTLTAGNGTWTGAPTGYSYQWLRCGTSGNNCSTISGATAQSYAVSGADGGKTLAVTVTATNPAGSASATSAATATVTTTAPTNTALPVISGSAQVGQTLSSTNGTWNGSPSAFSEQWEDCDLSGNNCSAIQGANAQTYTVGGADVGHTIEVAVTASNAAGSGSATSAATAAVPVPAPIATAPPVVSGTAQVGQKLAASNGTWSGSPTGYAYQWEDCDGSGNNCSPIQGAVSQSYTVAGGDAGSALVAVVTASNSGGSATASSAPTATVPAVAPANTGLPSVSGTAIVGQTLKASNGSWSGTLPSYSYQWQDCDTSGNNCVAIPGATAQSYTAATGDTGSTLEVTVTASNSAGSASATSAPTGAVTAVAPTNTAPPAVSGNPQLGQTLTSSTGSWSGAPTAYAYQWQDCDKTGNACVAIQGATSQSYTAASSDVGSMLAVTVTASNSTGSASANSAPTGVVAAAPPANTTAPVISGSARVGQTLTTNTGSWTGSPSGYAYQWEDCTGSGSGCTPISGATVQTYVVGTGDIGSVIEAVVTASNSGGSASASSAPTANVPQVPPGNTTPPTVSGTAQSGQTLTASAGSWSGTAVSYSYQWQRCDIGGSNCSVIQGATLQTYSVTTTDIGSTLEAVVTGSNASGSAAATSAPTATVQAAPSATFGKTSVGANSDVAGSNRKRVNRWTVSSNSTVTKLSIYLQPTATGGTELLEGVIYADASGSPSSLIAVSNQLSFASTNAAGWYDLTFATPAHLAPGTYWIGFMSGSSYGVAGFRWDSVAGTRAINSNTYTSGPSSAFGSFSTDSEQMSLYATYTPG